MAGVIRSGVAECGVPFRELEDAVRLRGARSEDGAQRQRAARQRMRYGPTEKPKSAPGREIKLNF